MPRAAMTLAGCILAASLPHVWMPWPAQGWQTDAVRGEGVQIAIGPNTRVTAPDAQGPTTEPHLVAHPLNPAHLLAAAIVSPAGEAPASAGDCGVFASFDGGRTWSRQLFGLGGCFDPWVALRADGVALFTALSGGGIVLYRSDDGGLSWGAAPLSHSLGRGHDHPTLAVETVPGRASGVFYLLSIVGGRNAAGSMTSTVFLARSDRAGRTFEPPLRIDLSNLNANTLNPVVLSDGTFVATTFDFMRHEGSFIRGGALERPRVWALVSFDGGRTFGTPLFVTEQCVTRSGFGQLAADQSGGPFHDRLYVVCAGRDGSILVHRSADRSETWSEPVRVDSASSATFRRTPSIAVNRNGVVAATWYERREACQHLHVTASTDGGETFGAARVVSTAESCPDRGDNGDAARRWPAGGDYSGLAAAADGRFHALWADSRDGRYQLMTASITVLVPR